jgi:hypothetical protein
MRQIRLQVIERAAGYFSPGRFYGRDLMRTQLEVVRDVMQSAADCDAWLTLTEISRITRYGEASISAQLRHLRKSAHGGFRVEKRRRGGEETAVRAYVSAPGKWEYRIWSGA